MNSGLLNRRIAEGHGKATAVVPSVELVLVVRAERLSGLAESNVLDRMVEGLEINDHAHGRTVTAGCRFHSGRRPRLRKGAEIQQPAQKRKTLTQRMVKSQGDGIAPLPGVVTSTAHPAGDLLYTLFKTLYQGFLERGIAGREPARPIVRQHVLEEYGAHSPVVAREVVAQFGFEDAFEHGLAGDFANQGSGGIHFGLAIPMPQEADGVLGFGVLRVMVEVRFQKLPREPTVFQSDNVGLNAQHVVNRERFPGTE